MMWILLNNNVCAIQPFDKPNQVTITFRAKHRNYIRISNMDYVYDGFVVYCDEDSKWVHEKLIPVLESDNFPDIV
jgi:hypothetical protein